GNLIFPPDSVAATLVASAWILPALWFASRLGVSDVLLASLCEAMRCVSIEFKHLIFVLWIFIPFSVLNDLPHTHWQPQPLSISMSVWRSEVEFRRLPVGSSFPPPFRQEPWGMILYFVW